MMTQERLALTTAKAGVSLLQFIPKDAHPLFALINKNRVHLNQHNEKTAAKYPDFTSVLRSITHPSNPARIRLGIWRKGVLVGTVNITPKGGFVSEIGYWVGSKFCSNGIATAATAAAIQFGRCDEYTNLVIAHAHVDNLASQKVLLKAGMCEARRYDTHVWFSVSTKS